MYKGWATKTSPCTASSEDLFGTPVVYHVKLLVEKLKGRRKITKQRILHNESVYVRVSCSG
jgi:hypothetical protein